MMSQTHVLLSAAAFTKPGAPVRNCAALLGAVLPDASIYVMLGIMRFQGVEQRRIWGEIYWQEPWQFFSAVSNSVPLFLSVFVLGLVLQRFAKTPALEFTSVFLAGLGLSALLHLAFDFPVHADDAHRHFWPITDWQFFSPLSYWDSRHFGEYVRLFEGLIGIAVSIILLRRFKQLWVRIAVGLALASYLLVPAFFIWSMSTG